jgi:hypothetical protein
MSPIMLTLPIMDVSPFSQLLGGGLGVSLCCLFRTEPNLEAIGSGNQAHAYYGVAVEPKGRRRFFQLVESKTPLGS